MTSRVGVFLKIFMHINVLTECVYVYHVHVWCPVKVTRGHLIPLKAKLQTSVIKYYVWLGIKLITSVTTARLNF